MLALFAASSVAFSPAGFAAPVATRAAAPLMADRKYINFDEDIVFEAREVSYTRKPVSLLSAIEATGVATFTAEAGVLSGAEEAGVFSTLENLGAFSLAESLLPTVESLGLLSKFEALLDVEAGLIFSVANFIIVSAPVIFALQICGFLPSATGPFVPLELLFAGGTLVGGGALFVTAFIISKLQIANDLA